MEYDGTDFVGWQIQDNGRSVQAVLESSIKEAFHRGARIVGAGRTDSGVHARGQVAHFDFHHGIEPEKVKDALNMRLPPDCQIVASSLVPDDFHARRDAKMKKYSYRLSERGRRHVIERRCTAISPYTLDRDAMFEATRLWLGKHDFSSFRASRCQAESPVRTLTSFEIERRDDLLVFTVEARSFLHHQIRNMVGTLVEIGRGAQSVAWAGEVLAAQSRPEAGPTMLPHGLCLDSITYKETMF